VWYIVTPMSAATVADLKRNALVSKLHDLDIDRLTPHMVVLDMQVGDVLQAAGEEVTDTWFPLDGSMAAFCVWVDAVQSAVEVALVGREGAIGGIVSNGRLPSYATARVVSAGKFVRIKISALENAKLESISLRHWFSRYSDCLLAQIFQTAACNATHTILQRTAKWLLAAVSRTSEAEFQLTQESLAEMLGVGRTFVTRVVSKLREDGVIETRRGLFIVKNEAALRAVACQCTTAIENHFDTVLHGIYPAN
jgi:CRP-like cAMP-binding protein